MTETALNTDELRQKIIKSPEVILDDHTVMRALVSANEQGQDNNIVDLRGIAMDRLEARLERLENTHRSVIAAAYENLASANMIHNAVLQMLDAQSFAGLLEAISNGIAEGLRVEHLSLVLESNDIEGDHIREIEHGLKMARPGFVDHYLSEGRDVIPRQVTLRQIKYGDGRIYGAAADWMRSEACLRLDLGEGRLPGVIMFGSEEDEKFNPGQASDLLAFFASALERILRSWLA